MKHSKFFAGIVLGAAVGAAISYLFTSGKGKEMVDALKNKANDAATNAEENLATAEAEVEKWVNKGKDWLNNTNNA